MAMEYGAPESSGLSKASVYRLAESVNAQLKVTPGANLESIVTKLGGRVQYQGFWEMEASASGSIKIQGEGDFDIYLPTHTGPLRDRFTIAHELGHYVLHFLYPSKHGKQVGPIQATRYGDGRVEWEANWFAAAFLMPEQAFTKSFRSHNEDIIAVAEKFGVSVAAAEVRAKALGLIGA